MLFFLNNRNSGHLDNENAIWCLGAHDLFQEKVSILLG